MSNVENTLKERGAVHGDFSLNAEIAQSLKEVCRPYSEKLTVEERESLDYILQKIARVLSKGGLYKDDWRDIAGYATLAMNSLDKYEGATDSKVIKMKLSFDLIWEEVENET